MFCPVFGLHASGLECDVCFRAVNLETLCNSTTTGLWCQLQVKNPMGFSAILTIVSLSLPLLHRWSDEVMFPTLPTGQRLSFCNRKLESSQQAPFLQTNTHQLLFPVWAKLKNFNTFLQLLSHICLI